MRSKKLDFFVSIVLIISRPLSVYHWVDAYPSDLLEIDPETDSIYIPPWNIRDALDQEAENEVVRVEEGLEDLQKVRYSQCLHDLTIVNYPARHALLQFSKTIFAFFCILYESRF